MIKTVLQGCRDILHLMFLKLKNIPISAWASSKEQVDKLILKVLLIHYNLIIHFNHISG